MAKIPAPPGATHRSLLRQGFRYMQSRFGNQEWIYWRQNNGSAETISATEVPDSPINLETGGTRQPERVPEGRPRMTRQEPATAVATPPRAIATAAAGATPWILAKAKLDESLPDHNGVDHKIRKDQFVVLKDNKDGSWAYATIWKGNLQWFNAHIPATDLAGKFERVTKDGQVVRGAKASKLAKDTFTPEEKKQFALTDEQSAIAQRFEQIRNSDESNHIIINARAGTGKTTMLKHLAKTYGNPGEKWLYLVFGKENQKQAKAEFPKFVDVYTTHTYCGKVLDENHVVKPTRRFAEFTNKGTKVDEILDGTGFRNMVEGLNIVHFESPKCRMLSGSVRKYIKKIWSEFSREVGKIVGLAKAYNVAPENAEQAIKKVVGGNGDPNYDINGHLERVKEVLEKDPSKDYINPEISKCMGIPDFMGTNFLDRMVKAAAWVLERSQPHGIDQPWQQKYEKKKVGGRDQWVPLRQPIEMNLRELRDFDDDLWFAARHADELDWTKPKKYDYVLVDEVQDFNVAQKVVLQHLIHAGAKVVAVGDPRQAMYRFRGADATAFEDITNMIKGSSKDPQGAEKMLTKNFRSKPALIARSNQKSVVKDLVSGVADDPNDPAYISEGEVKYNDMIDRLGKEMSTLGEMKMQTAMIARTNEPLAKAAMDLLKHKIPFVIYGKDLATEVLNTVNRVLQWQDYKQVNNDSYVRDFTDELNSFVNDKIEKWGGSARKAGSLKDLIEAQKALTASADVISQEKGENVTVAEFKDWLYDRLGAVPENMTKEQEAKHKKRMEEENPVILTTAHRSKGLEFDRVVEITPGLYPHPRTKLDPDFEQEANAAYVRGTRPRKEYIEVDDTEE